MKTPKFIKDILYKLHLRKAKKIHKMKYQSVVLTPKVLDKLMAEAISESPKIRTTEAHKIPKVEDEFGIFNPDRVMLNWCGCVLRKQDPFDNTHLEQVTWEGDTLVETHICRQRGIFKKIELTEK